jgi:hypothetical protein
VLYSPCDFTLRPSLPHGVHMRRLIVLQTVLLLVAACDRSETVVRDVAALSRVDVEPPGANCAAGGHAIRTGGDRDADGVLDDAEVTATQYACDAASRTLLVDPLPEPAGPNCATAGTAVRAGLDDDGDGVLDEGEVDRISYVCGEVTPPVLTRELPEPSSETCPAGGTRVEAGRDDDRDGLLSEAEVETTALVCGDQVLVRRDEVGWAPECAAGGTRVRSGADANGDGVLDDAEVASTVYVCSETVADFVVETQDDLDYLRDNVSFIRGNLAVRGTALAEVLLTSVAVQGSILVEDNPALTSVFVTVALIGGDVVIARNPKLERATVSPSVGSAITGSLLVSDNPALELFALYVPSVGGSLRLVRSGGYAALDGLEHVGGDLKVEECAGLTGILARSLLSVGGDVVFRDNDALETHGEAGNLLRVETVGGTVLVEGNAALRWFDFPYLRFARGLAIRDNPSLTTFDFFELSWIDGRYEVSGNPKLWSTGAGNGALRRISGDVVIARNGVVTLTGTLPVEQIDGEIVVIDNPALTHLWFQNVPYAARIRIERNASLKWVGTSPTSDPYGGFLVALRSTAVLRIADNPALARLRLPSLTHVGSLYVERNATLPACEAQALANQAGADVVSIAGNDDTATCP